MVRGSSEERHDIFRLVLTEVMKVVVMATRGKMASGGLR
jgi:hypothetical protein